MTTCSNCGKPISESRYYMITWWEYVQPKALYLCAECYQANKSQINNLVMTHGGYIYPFGQDW